RQSRSEVVIVVDIILPIPPHPNRDHQVRPRAKIILNKKIYDLLVKDLAADALLLLKGKRPTGDVVLKAGGIKSPATVYIIIETGLPVIGNIDAAFDSVAPAGIREDVGQFEMILGAQLLGLGAAADECV